MAMNVAVAPDYCRRPLPQDIRTLLNGKRRSLESAARVRG